jgi:hypothetical protein
MPRQFPKSNINIEELRRAINESLNDRGSDAGTPRVDASAKDGGEKKE